MMPQKNGTEIATAIQMFYTQYGRVPKSYLCSVPGTSGQYPMASVFNPDPSTCPGGYATGEPILGPPGIGLFGACDAPVPDIIGGDTTNLNVQAYNASMQELVNAGILSKIPHSPPGGPGYCYSAVAGFAPNMALLNTMLEYYPPSTTGVPPSCRPLTSSGADWCEQRNTTEYCLCVPY
jgi:hypothetical protein